MQKLMTVLPDAMIVAGGCSIAYGASLLHIAAGFIVGGVLASTFGVMAAKAAAKAVE